MADEGRGDSKPPAGRAGRPGQPGRSSGGAKPASSGRGQGASGGRGKAAPSGRDKPSSAARGQSSSAGRPQPAAGGRGVRGAAGGYQLLSPPEEISLGRVMEVIDGRCDEDSQNTSASPDSPIVKVLTQAWKEVAAVQHKMLDGITLANLLERAKTPTEQMYHI